jgi:hypothetical protein
LKGHLAGDIFGRDNLDFQSREFVTISALASMDGVNPQPQWASGVFLADDQHVFFSEDSCYFDGFKKQVTSTALTQQIVYVKRNGRSINAVTSGRYMLSTKNVDNPVDTVDKFHNCHI